MLLEGGQNYGSKTEVIGARNMNWLKLDDPWYQGFYCRQSAPYIDKARREPTPDNWCQLTSDVSCDHFHKD